MYIYRYFSVLFLHIEEISNKKGLSFTESPFRQKIFSKLFAKLFATFFLMHRFQAFQARQSERTVLLW